MKIFLISGDFPSGTHTVRAANRVLDALILELLDRGHEIALQVISATDLDPAFTLPETPKRLTLLPPFQRKDYFREAAGANVFKLSSRLVSRITNPIEFFYHASILRSAIDERIRKAGSDVALIFWNSDGLAATFGNHRVPKIAYYGMPDHESSLARLEDRELFGLKMSSASLALERQNLKSWESAHIALMKDCDVVTNLCADHARYYQNHGHARSLYVPNIWPEAATSTRPGAEIVRPAGKVRIFGNMGRLSATGNTYGLKYIGEELCPRLDKVLGSDGYEIHILGGGTPIPAVAKALTHPSIRLRGWVEDIDAEIMAADVFLVANNTGRYRGAHTRFLHGWSLKACCVAHSYNAQAMPEMRHGENVLLGETPDEIVSLIVTAAADPQLRARIGNAGWKTYQKYFTPKAVVVHLEREMMVLLEEKGSVAR